MSTEENKNNIKLKQSASKKSRHLNEKSKQSQTLKSLFFLNIWFWPNDPDDLRPIN